MIRGARAIARGAAASYVIGALLAIAPAARADDVKKACIDASDRGQNLREAQAYQEAREAFTRCAAEECPGLVRHDCTEWLREVEAMSPSIVIAVHDVAGAAVPRHTMTVDGAPVLEPRGPLPLDPGSHLLRFEAPGFNPTLQEIVVRSGDKNRAVVAVLSPIERSSSGSAGLARPPADARHGDSPRSVLMWTSVGLAAVAFSSEAYFGISGSIERSRDLSSSGCAPHCAASEADSIHTKFIVADASLGVGLAAAAAAVYLAVTGRPMPHAGGASFSVEPTRSGGMAGVGWRFR